VTKSYLFNENPVNHEICQITIGRPAGAAKPSAGGTHSDAEVAELRSKIDSLTLQVAVASGRAAHVEDAPMW